ncbi:MAG TPA: MFS transporter [Candidatus Binatia bacterium]|nr:MFS transporter [Candidatus Binatia bacterium]
MSKAPAQPFHATRNLSQTLSALRYRNYRLYWFGHLFSVLAQNMEHVAQSWLVLELTSSPLALGLTGLAHAIPSITLTLLGGVIADRTDRRRIMVAAQAGTALIFFILAALIVTRQVTLWQVMVLAFISGAIRAFDRPSRMALLPQMVPRDEIPNAVAIGGTIWQLNRLMGPAIAGIMIYLVGVGPTYGVCFLASATALCLWLLIRVEKRSAARGEGGLLRHMIDGLNFIRRNEIYYTFISMTFFNSVFGMSYLILMPVFARDILQVGSQGFGFLQSSGGAGALVGTLLVAYLAHFQKRGVMQAILGAIVFGALLIVFAFSSSYPLSLVLAFVLGLASQFYMTTINTVLQVNLPEQLRGRVMGIYGLTWDLMPVGGMVSGTIAEFAGAPAAVAIGGLLVAGMALAVVSLKPSVRRLDQ